jgi:photosystem II stability/assembly factor-like uncharacterized protein
MLRVPNQLRISAALLLSFAAAAVAQRGAPTTDAMKPIVNQPDNPELRGFHWRAIGPVGQGGRVDDFAVDEKNPSTYYIGFAVGGVLKTTNNGTTFEPIFEDHPSSIADLALAPSDPNILYIATGEANNRQTTSYGDGLYKSTDAGKTFTNIGFKDAQTLGRIVVSPKDPNTVWIAVGGHLYGSNAERGVFMTTDGGKTWNKTLYVDENTSATDIVIDPSNPNNLWAAMYQRERTAWGFNGGGPGSAIYNSTDGGRSWKKLSGNGLPRGTMGRIALDIPKNYPNVIYAQIEVAADKEPAGAVATQQQGRAANGGGRGGRGGAADTSAPPPNPAISGIWRSNDKGKSWTFMSNTDQRPMYFSQIRIDPNNPDIVYTGGVEPTKSEDGGKHFHGLNNMGHVDNHAIWIDPLNSKHVMYGNDGAVDVTWDGGEKWEAVRNFTAGLSYHSSVDMRHPYYVCTGLQDNGSWCGPSSVRSPEGIRQWMWMSVGGGDGFQNAIDPTDFNVFYTESQNAGINRYNTETGEQKSIKPAAAAQGGRGGAGGGGGGFGRGGSPIINPIAGAIVQFNWNSPILLSPHNPSTIYLGGKSLYISRDRGNSWFTTKDLSKGIDLNTRQIMGVSYSEPNCSGGGGGGGGRGAAGARPGEACILSKHDGYVANEFGTMTEVAESPVLPGILWAGTDDGNVQLSKDGGYNWEEVGKNIPGVNHEYYVSGLEASWYDAGTAYVALDGHRNDDLKPYIFKTTDYGKSWTSVTGNLPTLGNVNAIRQDPVNRNLLYAPTEMGFYVSLDDGHNWSKFMPNLPTGRVDEVVVHPRDHDLILSTHSRSVWVMDDITALEAMTPEMARRDVLFPVRDAVAWKQDRRISTGVFGDKWWAGENAPAGTAISFNLAAASGDATIKITDAVTGQEIRTATTPTSAGLNRWQWNLCGNAPPPSQNAGFGGGGGRGGNACQGAPTASVGTYKATVSVGGKEVGTQMFKVLEDIWLNER